MGNASLLDVYGSDNMDLLIGLKQDGNVETNAEILKRLVEQTLPRIISQNEFSIPNRWVPYANSLPGIVFHKNFGVVLVVAQRVINVPQTNKPEYKAYAVCPVKALIDPRRNYVDTRLPEYAEPIVLYEVSEYAIYGSYQYELFRFKERIIYRLVYNEQEPGKSSVEMADIEDQTRNGWSIRTTLESLLQSPDIRDKAAIELFIRTYPSWCTQMNFTRIYTTIPTPSPTSNYIPPSSTALITAPSDDDIEPDVPRIYKNSDKTGIDYKNREEIMRQEAFAQSIQSISKASRLRTEHRKPHISRALNKM